MPRLQRSNATKHNIYRAEGRSHTSLGRTLRTPIPRLPDLCEVNGSGLQPSFTSSIFPGALPQAGIMPRLQRSNATKHNIYRAEGRSHTSLGRTLRTPIPRLPDLCEVNGSGLQPSLTSSIFPGALPHAGIMPRLRRSNATKHNIYRAEGPIPYQPRAKP
jgi:hypothetical protein